MALTLVTFSLFPKARIKPKINVDMLYIVLLFNYFVGLEVSLME